MDAALGVQGEVRDNRKPIRVQEARASLEPVSLRSAVARSIETTKNHFFMQRIKKWDGILPPPQALLAQKKPIMAHFSPVFVTIVYRCSKITNQPIPYP